MELKKSADSFSQGSGRPNVNEHNERGIGKFTVLCNGVATIPASWCNSVWSWLLILTPSTLQIIYINSAFAEGWTIFIQILYVCTLVITLSSLLFTTCSDPGIVPRPLAYEMPQETLLPKKKTNRAAKNTINGGKEDDMEISQYSAADTALDTSDIIEEIKVDDKKKPRRKGTGGMVNSSAR